MALVFANLKEKMEILGPEKGSKIGPKMAPKKVPKKVTPKNYQEIELY